MEDEDRDEFAEELAEADKLDPDASTRVWAGAQAQTIILDLVDARKAAGITTIDMARRLATSRGYLHKLENRIIDPGFQTVARYAAVIGYKLELKRIPKKAAAR
jgi:DNA-binding XRE family transcriptional regulator